MASKLSVLLLSLLHIWALSTDALPQVPSSNDGAGAGDSGVTKGDNDAAPRNGSIDDSIRVLVNGKAVMMPRFDTVYVSHTEPLDSPIDLRSASIYDAPPGYACVFASDSTAGSTSRKAATKNAFVSETFYSLTSSSFDSPLFSRFGLDRSTGIRNARYLMCFQLPDPAKQNRRVAVALDLRTTGSPESSVDEEEQQQQQQQQLERSVDVQFVQIRGFSIFNFGYAKFPNLCSLSRAAIAHAPKDEYACSVRLGPSGPIEQNLFTTRTPLLTTLENPDGIACSSVLNRLS